MQPSYLVGSWKTRLCS